MTTSPTPQADRSGYQPLLPALADQVTICGTCLALVLRPHQQGHDEWHRRAKRSPAPHSHEPLPSWSIGGRGV